ncbi:BatD family protein [Ochrobactrum vermis]|uniref:BatD family protein n=1 Tax=Ochrobactrum vermis TaxID=1827297 RepID=A0ABU8P938_9HYPH|nr:BatD family protein [Ochrobactrum vermis]PQZ29319.1 hypothetical protein CQZ93_03370 [Ochrobactrum vermis]
MIKSAIAIFFMLLTATTAFGAEPFAHANVHPAKRIVPGQQVLVDIEIFVPEFFTSPPQFPALELANAVVSLSTERSENIMETVDNVRFTGIRKSLAVVPETPGTFTLPAFTVTFGQSVNGTATKSSVEVPSVSFNVENVAGNEKREVLFAARNVTLQQSFDRDSKSLRVGDALVRTITITAESTQAMMIPPLDVGTVPDLKHYVKTPRIDDNVSQGRQNASRRTEVHVYTASREGSYVLPAIKYAWFDVSSATNRSSDLAAVPISVSTASPPVDGIVPELSKPTTEPFIQRQKAALIVIFCLVLAGIVWLISMIAPKLQRAVKLLRRKRQATYRYRLKLLRHRIRSGTYEEIYSGLHEWSRFLGYRDLNEWTLEGSAPLRIEVENLSQTLFGTPSRQFDRNALLTNIEIHHRSKGKPAALPPLNPFAQS